MVRSVSGKVWFPLLLDGQVAFTKVLGGVAECLSLGLTVKSLLKSDESIGT